LNQTFLKGGDQILASRANHGFFVGLKDKFDEEINGPNRRRLDINEVMEAAHDCILNREAGNTFEQKVRSGDKSYN